MLIRYLVGILLFSCNAYGQIGPVKQVRGQEFGQMDNSKIPNVDSSLYRHVRFCKPFFSELPFEQIEIVKKPQLIPLTTVPSFLNFFRKKKNWKYRIAISTKTIEKLEPILFDNLSLEGQLGVLGHELSHVADFHSHSRWYLLKVLFWHLSPRKMDAFEYNTDLICIQHAMGYQLLAWSNDTNNAAQRGTLENPFKYERYMYPATIEKYISEMEIYQSNTTVRP